MPRCIGGPWRNDLRSSTKANQPKGEQYDRYQAKEDSERLNLPESYRAEAPLKAVLPSATPQMLERALHINSVRATAGKNHVTTVEPEVTNTYKPDTPKGVKPVTDGTPVVDVCRYNGAVLETVSFPLPI